MQEKIFEEPEKMAEDIFALIKSSVDTQKKKKLKGFLVRNEDGSMEFHTLNGTIFDWTKEQTETVVKTLDRMLREDGFADPFVLGDHTEKTVWNKKILQWKDKKGTGEFGYRLFVNCKRSG